MCLLTVFCFVLSCLFVFRWGLLLAAVAFVRSVFLCD